MTCSAVSLARVMNEEEDNKGLQPPTIGSIAERRKYEQKIGQREEWSFVQRSNRKEKLQLRKPCTVVEC